MSAPGITHSAPMEKPEATGPRRDHQRQRRVDAGDQDGEEDWIEHVHDDGEAEVRSERESADGDARARCR